MHYKLLPEDDMWRIITPKGKVMVQGSAEFPLNEALAIAIHLSGQGEKIVVTYLGPWRGCMKHVTTKYVVENKSVVECYTEKNPNYDPNYPITVYVVRRRRGGAPGVILGAGISTPKKARSLTHKEKRNIRRQKLKRKEAAKFKRSPKVLRERAEIRRQIARFRKLYSKRQGPVAKAV